MARAVFLGIVGLPLAACSLLADPTYAPPTDAEARSAYIAGQLADATLLETKPLSDLSNAAPPVAEAQAYAKGWDEFRTAGTIDALRKTDAIDKIAVSNCEWQRIDTDQVENFSKPRIADRSIDAYFCDVEEFVTQNYGIKAKAATTGYFYKDANGWMYIGKYAHGYQPY